VTIPLALSEEIVCVKPGKIEVEKTDFKNNILAKFDPLTATNGEFVPSKISQLPDLFPPSSFTVNSSGIDSKGRTGSIKYFPIHIQGETVYLTNHCTLLIGISDQIDVVPKPNYSAKKSLIISPDSLISEAEELKQIHRIDGYDSEVITLESIQQDFTMAEPLDLVQISCFLDVSSSMRKRFSNYDSDTSRKIRQFLQTRIDQKSVDYVTILGDATYIPPSDYIFSTYNPDTYDRAIPTDFFYMSPACDGVDYTIQISVGRIPVRSKDEAKTYLQKMKRYRKAYRKSWFDSVTLFGGDLFEDDFYGEIQSDFMIDQGDFLGQKVTKKYQTEGLYNRDSILSTLSQGNNGFVVMSSHGRGDYLRLPHNYIDSADILKQPILANLPIFVSDSCLNGSWDTRLSGIRYGTDPYTHLPTSFSQSLLLSQGGSIAYIGGSRINYAGMDYDYTEGVVESTRLYNTDALLHYVLSSYGSKDTTLGEITCKGLSQFIQQDMDYPGDWVLKALFGFCLLGDPTLKLPAKSVNSPNKIEIEELPVLGNHNSGEIPTLSLDQENKFIIHSDEKELKVIVSDYDSWDKPVLFSETVKPSEPGVFEIILPSLIKTRLCIRICNLSGNEKRFVAKGNYNQDLRISPQNGFLKVKAGEKINLSFLVTNDGLEEANDVLINILDGNETIFQKSIPRLIPQQQLNVNVPGFVGKLGTLPLAISCDPLPKETFTKDNSITVTFQILNTAIQRIGIFEYQYGLDGSQIRDKIWMDQINQVYIDQKQQFEIQWIAPKDMLHLEKLDLNLLVLYNTPYFDDESDLIAELEQFTSQGGKVLLIGPASKKLRSLAGIKATEQFTVHQGDSSFQSFSPMKSYSSYFTKASFPLPIFESYSPENKSLTEVIKNDTAIVGVSQDEILYLTVHDSYYYYSGLLSKLDFERKAEAFTFFIDLLSLPLLRN
jgi:hypothetical protein